jgi:cytochrome c oxidase subunit II
VIDRAWSLFFLLIPILGIGVFVWAMTGAYPMEGHWLPKNVNEYGDVIDDLFMFILYLTGVIFLATGIAMFWFLWKYSAANNVEAVNYTHGSHTLEVVWSILPAVTLLFIAIYQMDAWADAKMRRPMVTNADGEEVPMPPIARVTGRQFEWRIQYAGPDGVLDTKDDIFTVNELHLPAFEEVVLQIQSEDVLHSFFLPNLRIKQDVVPGLDQYSWFKANETGKFDIVCAELCGWGHYKMRGEVTLESRDKFEAFLTRLQEEQQLNTFEPSADEEE